MPSAYQQSGPAAPAQPPAGEAFNPGLTPGVFSLEPDKFKCPCHGSGFKRDGTNFEGPAPRPLDRIKIVLTAEGILQVDKSAIFRMAPGNPEGQYPQSILKV